LCRYDAGSEQTEHNENRIIEIVCFRSIPQLLLTLDYYYQIASTHLYNSIENEMNGEVKYALIVILKSILNLPK